MNNIKFPKIKNINLKSLNIEDEFVYYYDSNSSFCFEAHFKDGKFEHEITYSEGEDENGHIKDWHIMYQEIDLYKHIRRKAIVDYIISKY